MASNLGLELRGQWEHHVLSGRGIRSGGEQQEFLLNGSPRCLLATQGETPGRQSHVEAWPWRGDRYRLERTGGVVHGQVVLQSVKGGVPPPADGVII